MSVQTWTFITIVSSFALYIGIAIWSRVRTTEGFYVAGRGVSAVANGMATAADWMSAASFISMAGLIAFMGADGSADPRATGSARASSIQRIRSSNPTARA